MEPIDVRSLRRILAVRLDNIGDVVLLSPALRALATAAPQAEITLLCSPAGSRVAPLLPWVSDTIVARTSWQDASNGLPHDPAREQALIAEIAGRRFDAAFVFTSFSQTPHTPGYVCYLAGIPVRAGQPRDFGGSIFSHAIRPPEDDCHQAERNLHLVEGAGISAAGRHLELRVPPREAALGDALLAHHGIAAGEPFALFAPGASCQARRYPAERFAQAARRVSAAGLCVVAAGAEQDAVACEAIAGAAGPGAANIAGATSIPEFARVVSRAAVVVCNDSGPMHIAEAFARPMTVLFAGTDLQRQWAPRASHAILLQRPTPCAPCYGFTCDRLQACLDIDPWEVAQHALALAATVPSAKEAA